MEFLDAPHNNEVEIKIFGSGLFIKKNNPFQILYFTRSTHMEERQIEVPDLDLDEASDSESIKSPKMETVEVIKLHMTADMPKGNLLWL